ncbi:MAG: pyridoxal phosphate-dependent aminotransferase [Gammaproteobacteria bacterium]|nr:pyridoxal phosphate-dependent aminotransferase [Gammaproteobacteria bacterium]
MTRLTKRIESVKPSATITISAKAMELRAKGVDVISLSQGEPDFDTPNHIKEAAFQAIKDGKTKYTPVDGTPEIKEAIIKKFKRDNNLEYKAENILVSTGAKHTLFNLFQSVLEEGNEAIVISPYWVSYPDMVILAGAKPIVVNTLQKNNFDLDLDHLRQALTDNTRLIILNSPSNPTGVTFTKEQYHGIGSILKDYPKVLIATDDMYEHIFWGNHKFCSFAEACPDLFERTITINGVSKAYAMTGWRIGYCGGPVDIVKAMKKIQGQNTSNASSISQAAATAALNGSHNEVIEMVKAYEDRHQYLCEALNNLDGFKVVPGTGAFYLFPDVSKAIKALGMKNDLDFSEYLLEKAGVAVVPGTAFGAEGFIRISYATSMSALEQSISRIKKVLR